MSPRAPRLVRLGLVVLLAAACATPQGGGAPVTTAAAAEVPPEVTLERQMWNRLVGRWEGQVDLTFPDATLLVNSVKRVQGRWVVEAVYGTTNVFLAEVPATLDVAGGQTALVVTTQLGDARLALWQEDNLRGSLRLSADGRDRSIELRRVASTRGVPQARPSTAVERVGQTLREREPAAQTARAAAPEPPAASPPPPVKASTLGDLATALPGLLTGRWEGSIDFAVSARLLIVDSVKPESGGWNVQARYGVADADLGPVAITLDLTDDRVTLRFTSTLASRVVLTLGQDTALRGGFKLAFEASERRMELKRIDPRDRDPLTVALRSPANQARVSEPAAVVAAVVSAGRGIAQVTVTLNGVEVHTQTERAAARSVAVSKPVTLAEGTNVIVVTARDVDGLVRQEMATIVYARPAAAATAVAPARAAGAPGAQGAPATASATARVVGERWAVVIGVGQFESRAIPRLRYATADAEAVYQTLTTVGGFKKDNVKLLTDKSEQKPTLRNLRQVLGTFLARNPQKEDTVLIFFAGHGAPEVDARGVERDGLAKYLIPSDADPDDLYATALPMDEIRTIFERIEAERVVVFLDTCYSGAGGGRTFAAKNTRATSVDDDFLQRLARVKGRAIITASKSTEVSLELAELGHGIFTYYLVEGLKGAADLDRDGVVTLQEIYTYVESQVSRRSRAVGGNQHPVLKGELEGSLPLVQIKR
ncbi:MAG: caspase family protein [Candidatus Rokuibacteriota bacterium]